jgi:hypothetical protein
MSKIDLLHESIGKHGMNHVMQKLNKEEMEAKMRRNDDDVV